MRFSEQVFSLTMRRQNSLICVQETDKLTGEWTPNSLVTFNFSWLAGSEQIKEKAGETMELTAVRFVCIGSVWFTSQVDVYFDLQRNIAE